MRGHAILFISAAALAGCATTDSTTPNRYQTEMSELEARCKAREGILVPTGATSSNPAVEYACRINGVATRL